MNGPWSKAVRPRGPPAFHRLGRAIFDLGLREPVATMAKKLDDVAPAQRHVGISRNESPGCGYGALTAEMCSEQFFETLAVHGARSLSTSGCAPSTNAITAAEKRSPRLWFRHSTTGANCGLPLGLACLPSQSRTGLQGRAAHGPFGPTKIGQSTSFSSIGSSAVANPRKVPLTDVFHETRRIRGHSARSLGSRGLAAAMAGRPA